ncbi:MAG TPA: SCO family protein [Flavobacteriaceae bacterium]|nr:SCO family protein [Flavobacteriaceae bacterium]
MNQQTVKKSYAFLKFALVFIILGISSIYFLTSQKRKLPVYNPYDVNPKLVDSKIQHVKNGHKIADFNLINQNGKVITQKDYDNKIYVADFFFTRCTTICPIMSTHMADLQKEFKNNDDIKFLSMSVTPVIDSVSVLKAYAETKGAIDTKWNLTTGDKKHIYQLARKSFMAVLDEGDGGIQDFIHTEQFILVDKKKQIRGFYDGTSSEDIQRLIDDIKLLNESN